MYFCTQIQQKNMTGPQFLILGIIIALVIAFIITMLVLNANAKKIIDINSHLVESQNVLVELNKQQGSEIEKRMNELEEQNCKLEEQKSKLDEQKVMIETLLHQHEELAHQLKHTVPDEVLQLKQQIQEHREHLEMTADMTDDELMLWIDGQMSETHLFTDSSMTLKKMAKALGLTQKRLGELFKNHPKYGSLGEYLNEKRFLCGCQLLREEPNWTIEAVGDEAGFGGRRTFQLEVKRRLGVTPVQYRQSQGLDVAPKHE